MSDIIQEEEIPMESDEYDELAEDWRELEIELEDEGIIIEED